VTHGCGYSIGYFRIRFVKNTKYFGINRINPIIACRRVPEDKGKLNTTGGSSSKVSRQ
jgi:hypothetical protein